MDLASRQHVFIDRALERLARRLSFHPIGLVAAELVDFGTVCERVLMREHPDGYRQMVMVFACDSAEDLAERAERVVAFALEHPELTRPRRLRIACVGVGAAGLARRRAKHCLKPSRHLDNQVVVRRFWLSLDRRRMAAAYSPWGFAPAFEINPCDPDENVFVELVRRDRYLTEPPAGPVTEADHRITLAHERAFVSGLLGRNFLLWTILAVNVAVWLVLELTGGSRSPVQLIRAGAMSDGLIRAGQWWRFVTPIFMHYGLFHLVLNSIGLIFLGEVLEHLYGSRQFALLYFGAGILSVATSFLFGNHLMVGASGAIFGLAGALVVYGWRYRRRIPRRYSAMFGGGLVPLIVINLIFGAVVAGIDNAAHVGGLLAGMLLTLVLVPLADEQRAGTRLAPRHLAALALAGVVAGALAVAVVQYVRFDDVWDYDARWTLTERAPGDVDLVVPADWMKAASGADIVQFTSICYDASVEVTRRDAADLRLALAVELKRILAEGFQPAANTTLEEYVWQVTSRGRFEDLLTGVGRAEGRQRKQVFLFFDKHLVSVGVEVAEKDAADFAPVQDRILSRLPVPAAR